jgi:hypothetical protein
MGILQLLLALGRAARAARDHRFGSDGCAGSTEHGHRDAQPRSRTSGTRAARDVASQGPRARERARRRDQSDRPALQLLAQRFHLRVHQPLNIGDIAMKRPLTISALVAVALSTATAFADPPKEPRPQRVDAYGYTFTDDSLLAGAFGPVGATILIRPGAARCTLIRPRTTFVVEMLKSVETL